MKDLLRWIIKITLVLGLAMFSGQGSAFKSFSPTLTKTELAETRSRYPKKATCFKKACAKHVSFQQSFNRTSSFAFSLVQYDTIVRVKFRDNFKMLTLLKNRDKIFQSCHGTNSRYEASDIDKSKG